MTPKIVLIAPAFPKTSETFIVSKFTGLIARGYDVKIVCSRSEPKEWERFPNLERFALKKRILVNPPTSPRWLVVLLFPIVFFKTLIWRPAATLYYLRHGWALFGAGIIKRFYLDARLIAEQPDLIHFEFGALAVNRTYLGELLDSKILVSFRGYDLNFSGLNTPHYYDEVWEQADKLHFLGEDLRNRALRRGCPPEKSYALIPPAIAVEIFTPTNLENLGQGQRPHPLRLLSVGRIEWKKGYEYALEAVAMLVQQGVSLEYRIVGDGSYFDAVAFCRHTLGLERHVTFLGVLTSDDVREQMTWADVFVHAAVSEGFCNAVIEAQSMRLPVVCTDADGLPENVVNGETGFVVARRNPTQLSEKIAMLACEPDLRKRMGEAGRKHVQKHFTLDQQLDEFAALYESTLRDN